MERVVLSPEGHITLPTAVLDRFGLVAGSELLVDVRGGEIVLAKEPAWLQLRGIASDISMADFASFRQDERRHEETGS